MARWGFDSASLQLSDSSEKCPHPERANFPLLMTWGGADAINSSYLRALELGANSFERHISQDCTSYTLPLTVAPKGSKMGRQPPPDPGPQPLDHKNTMWGGWRLLFLR